MTELSWKPRLRGDVYCAPACGGGCKRDDYDRCMLAAKLVAETLGDGWKTRVHEHLGWWASVISPCRRIKVSISFHRGEIDHYTAYLGEPDTICSGRWVESGKTAREAVRKVIATAKSAVAATCELVEGL